MIDYIKNSLNNREIATLIWVTLFIFVMLLDNNIRKSIGGVLKALMNKWISISILAMLIYVSLMVYGFYKINIWDLKLLKGTILWTFGVAFIMLMNSQKALKDDNYFKKIILDNFKLLVVFTFIVNLYVFNLITEVIIIPVMILFVLLQVRAESKEDFKQVKNILDYVAAILSIGYLIFAIIMIFKDTKTFLQIDNLKSFLLPIVLTILFIPFAYLYALLMLYQTFFVRLKFTIKKNNKLIKYSKRKVFWKCGFNLKKIKKVTRKMIFFDIKDKNDLKIELNNALINKPSG